MDIDEFKIVVLPLKDKLYRLAIRLLNDSDDAEDVVQETFIRLWIKRRKLKEKRSIEAFAMTITKNLSIDTIRSRKYLISESAEKIIKMNYDKLMRNSQQPYKQVELSEAVNNVNKIIQTLPEKQKLAIHLRDLEGYEYKEIEEITGLSL